MLTRLGGCEKGFSLIEIIVALMLLGLVATGLLAAMATGLRVSLIVEDQTTSASMVTSQLEDTLSRSYVEPAEYPTVSLPEGFSLSFDNLILEPTLLERIKVSIFSAAKELYYVTTFKVNSSFVASPPTLLLAQRDFRWYENVDSLTPVTALEAESTPYTVRMLDQVVRLRMSLQANRLPLSAGEQTFKLQYATSTDGPWTDVGAAGSAETWRGYNNPTADDGDTLPSLLLSQSDVLQSYEEENSSVLNPNSVAVGEYAEWDWVIQENGASFSTSYLFRMVEVDGTAFGSYTRYPVLAMPPPLTFGQFDYRWFENAD